MCSEQALCYSSRMKRSDPGRIMFIKQTKLKMELRKISAGK